MLFSEPIIDFNANLTSFLKDKSIIILGFGREGISTYNLLRKLLPNKYIGISDRYPINNDLLKQSDVNIEIIVGENYLDRLEDYDLIIKSPGISLKNIDYSKFRDRITSQTDLFLRFLSHRVIGITGTKGKSTTATLIYDILKQKYDARLVGNIGVPFFNKLENISTNTIFIAEFSANQLQFINNSPHYSILLNIYPEHLDHFLDFAEYKSSKMNILKYQNAEDYALLNFDENMDFVENIKSTNQIFITENNIDKENHALVKKDNEFVFNYNKQSFCYKFENKHNNYFINHFKCSILFAISIAKILEVEANILVETLSSFKGLEHRLEFIGNFAGKKFYNDSICTIPESAIKAIKTILDAQTIIIGGLDRGIEYNQLIDFISISQIENIVLIPDVGKRIMDKLISKKKITQNVFFINEFEEAIIKAIEVTDKNRSCLLSPAAASYNKFKNFEERGKKYKEIISYYFQNV